VNPRRWSREPAQRSSRWGTEAGTNPIGQDVQVRGACFSGFHRVHEATRPVCLHVASTSSSGVPRKYTASSVAIV